MRFARGRSASSLLFTFNQSDPWSFLHLGEPERCLFRMDVFQGQLEWHLEVRQRYKNLRTSSPKPPVAFSLSSECPGKLWMVTQPQSHCFFKEMLRVIFAKIGHLPLMFWGINGDPSHVEPTNKTRTNSWHCDGCLNPLSFFFFSPHLQIENNGNPFGIVGRLETKHVGINSWSLWSLCDRCLFLNQENNSCSSHWIFFKNRVLF